MKKVIVIILTGLGIICTAPNAYAREYMEHISKSFTLTRDASASKLVIYNISGFIKVEGYSGNSVIVEIDKVITADNDKNLEAGKNEFKIVFDQNQDSITIYIAEPIDSRPNTRWEHRNREKIGYDFNLEFTVKVPFAMNLNISTINNGDINVNNVAGNLIVNNVNAPVIIKNAKGRTYAHTVNGGVSVSYQSNPDGESSYYTINGDINVSYQPDLSADLSFKSMTGDFFTDFPSVKLLPAVVNKVQVKSEDGIIYKVNARTRIRFGNGGHLFRFETLNGNVYIRKQS